MLRKLLLAILAALLLMIVPGGAAFAYQDGPPVACGDLASEDCDFLKESAAAMQGLESYSAQLDMGISLADLPTLPPDLAFAMSSDSVIHVDPALSAQMMALQGMSPEDLADNMEMVADLVSQLYFAIAYDITLDLQLSGDLANVIAAQSGVPVPETLTLPLRMVDGYLYLNVDDLAAQIPGGEGVQGWFGVDVGTAMADALQQSVAQLQAGEMASNPMAAGLGAVGIQQNMELQQTINDYTLVERLADAELDGIPVAQFVYGFDLAGFLASPEFAEFARTQLQMMAASDPEMSMSEQDLETLTTMLPMMAPMLLSGLSWETVSAIGLEDHYVYATETRVDWNLASIIAMAAMIGEICVTPGGAPAFTYDLVVTNADFNDAPPVEAPADAIIIPLEAFAEGSSM